MWKELVLAYLSQRLPQSSDERLDEAIKRAPNQAVEQFLRDYKSLQLNSLQANHELVQSFENSAQAVHSTLSLREDILVIQLVKTDGLSPLPYAYLHFPLTETQEALSIGQDAVKKAIELSDEIGQVGLGCKAFYLTLKGKLLYEKRGNNKEELTKAIKPLQEAKKIYEEQLNDNPIYAGFCGITYVHIMRAQRAQSNYPQAQRAGQKAINYLTRGAELTPDFVDHLALAERNLASILRETGDLDEASQLCESALTRLKDRLKFFGGGNHRKDRLSQNEYNAEVAMTYITLAGIFVKRARLSNLKAEEAHLSQLPLTQNKDEFKSLNETLFERYLKEAMSNIGLAQIRYNTLKETGVFGNGRRAMLHYTYGQVYEMNGDIQNAKSEYQEALALWESASNPSSGGDKSYAAGVLRRIGVLHRESKEYTEALRCFAEAAERFHLLKEPLEEAVVQCEWAVLEEQRDNREEAGKKFKQCTSLCLKGMKGLPEHDNDIVFRWKIRRAYMWLIRQLADRAQTQSLTRDEEVELLVYLESLRSLEGKIVTIDRLESQIRHFLQPDHELRVKLKVHAATFLWIQADGDEIIFVGLQHGKLIVGICPSEFSKKFCEIVETIHTLGNIVKMFSQRNEEASILPRLNIGEKIQLFRSLASKVISGNGEECFNFLPTCIQDLFESKYDFIFTSNCGHTVSWPFELMQSLDVARDDKERYENFVGMHTLMPQVHSLSDLLSGLLEKQPPNKNRQALLIGNPKHDAEQEDLPGASVKAFAKTLKNQHVFLAPQGNALTDVSATWELVEKAIKSPNLCLWFHAGHGFPLGETEIDSYLPLANGDRFTLRNLDKSVKVLPNTVVFLDCCHMGVSELTAGGQMNGFPSALLRKGASCVLASSFAVHDDLCAIFSKFLASAAFSTRPNWNVGKAVLRARQKTLKEMRRKGLGNQHTLAWGLLTSWGSPLALLGARNED